MQIGRCDVIDERKHDRLKSRIQAQWKLKAILIALFALVIGISALGLRLSQGRHQRLAVEAIENQGGTAYYGSEVADPQATRSNQRHAGVSIWQGLLGRDCLERVTSVYLEGKDTGPLGSLAGLQSVILASEEFDDDDLSSLSGLRRLKSLDISATRVSDAGIGHLANMPWLEKIFAREHQFSQQGLEQLTSALPNTGIFPKSASTVEAAAKPVSVAQ